MNVCCGAGRWTDAQMDVLRCAAWPEGCRGRNKADLCRLLMRSQAHHLSNGPYRPEHSPADACPPADECAGVCTAALQVDAAEGISSGGGPGGSPGGPGDALVRQVQELQALVAFYEKKIGGLAEQQIIGPQDDVPGGPAGDDWILEEHIINDEVFLLDRKGGGPAAARQGGCMKSSRTIDCCYERENQATGVSWLWMESKCMKRPSMTPARRLCMPS
eukprot:354921-Chlamydomonas_euryale.AAC.17